MTKPTLSALDKLICGVDRAVRTLSPGLSAGARTTPAQSIPATQLTEVERRHSAGLMRVNHAGEVCAQALYQGQALTAKLNAVQKEMENAADEESDHLAWCQQRLSELNSQPSLLNPLWYGLSFGLGATAGMVSDKISLGFVAATEEQVCAHLQAHLTQLPDEDHKSRAILRQMLTDEAKHAHSALDAGAIRFPRPIKAAMTVLSKVMTKTTYRF